jgi:hypothetical protein
MAGAGLYEIKTYGGRLAAREAFKWLGFPLCAFQIRFWLFFLTWPALRVSLPPGRAPTGRVREQSERIDSLPRNLMDRSPLSYLILALISGVAAGGALGPSKLTRSSFARTEGAGHARLVRRSGRWLVARTLARSSSLRLDQSHESEGAGTL